MKRCKMQMIRVCFFSLAIFLLTALPSYGQQAFGQQRSTFGIDLGQTSDRFGALPRTTTGEADVEGKFIVLQHASSQGDPNIVAGGEILLPVDTSTHASEFAAYAGPEFLIGSHLMLGFHAQVRKIYPPNSDVNGLFFNRYKMLLLELPAVLEYRFGSARHAFIQGQVSPVFAPHYTASSAGASQFPHPSLDHAYTIRGSVGYTFGRWYAKASYETRYLKFSNNLGNPMNLNSWRSDKASGGIGVVF
jgi:hypothetical protein